MCVALLATARGRSDTESHKKKTTGAVIAVGHSIISVGYSGLIKGATPKDEPEGSDAAVHAELNAFLLRSAIPVLLQFFPSNH